MSTPVTRIQNADMVTSWFGYWPSFHDAEVLEMVLSRDGTDGSPSLSATIHAFEMTNEVTPEGYFLCHKHAVVTLLFEGLDAFALDGFNHQNALSGLSITEANSEGPLTVNFDGDYGLESELTCRRIEVVSIVAGIPAGSVFSRAKT
jgi:hypothetical protein